jgi:pyrrolidone-carboxylate peptidase
VKNLILTGFGPYKNFATNLSSEIAKQFSLKYDEIYLLRKKIPVSWKQSIKSYKLLLSELNNKPDLVVLLGIHSSKEFHLEKFGWNIKFGVDNEKSFKFGPIKLYSLPWIKTILDLRDIYSNLEDKLFISISNFPGLYLCNYLYYWALYLSKKQYPVIFIHIPARGDLSEIIKKVKFILVAIIKSYFKKELKI